MDKKEQYIMIKVLAHQEDTLMHLIKAFQNSNRKKKKKKLIKLKGKHGQFHNYT